VWTDGGMLSDPTSHQSKCKRKSKCYTPGVESRVGGCEERPLAPVSDQITATTRTTRTSGGHEAANRRQAAGGRQQAIGTHQVCTARCIQRGQLAAGTRRAASWEGERGSGVSRTQVGHRDPDGLRAPLPPLLTGSQVPGSGVAEACAPEARPVCTRCLCNYLLGPRRPAASWPGGGLRVVSAQGPRQAVQACSA
jgi:hypothetical protein